MSRLKAVDFIEAYKRAKSLDEMSRTTGMTIAAIKSRAWYYRHRGIDLPYFNLPRGEALEQLKEQVKDNG